MKSTAKIHSNKFNSNPKSEFESFKTPKKEREIPNLIIDGNMSLDSREAGNHLFNNSNINNGQSLCPNIKENKLYKKAYKVLENKNLKNQNRCYQSLSNLNIFKKKYNNIQSPASFNSNQVVLTNIDLTNASFFKSHPQKICYNIVRFGNSTANLSIMEECKGSKLQPHLNPFYLKAKKPSLEQKFQFNNINVSNKVPEETTVQLNPVFEKTFLTLSSDCFDSVQTQNCTNTFFHSKPQLTKDKLENSYPIKNYLTNQLNNSRNLYGLEDQYGKKIKEFNKRLALIGKYDVKKRHEEFQHRSSSQLKKISIPFCIDQYIKSRLLILKRQLKKKKIIAKRRGQMNVRREKYC